MSAPTHGFGAPCLPTRVKAAPVGSAWVHEIKHDGYRLMVRRTSDGVRIKTRRGFNWTDRFPLIVEAAERLRAVSFVLDGEGVILREDGIADFDRLHSRRHDNEVQLLGFENGDDALRIGLERLAVDQDEHASTVRPPPRRSPGIAPA